MRAAVYARFSSDLQRSTSIDDQIATARRYAEAQGWVFLPEHVYVDSALSGASLDRPGIQALRHASQQRPRPFDVLLVDDSSRVSRDLADAVRLLQELKFAGIRVLYLSQNIDSANEQAEALVGLHGIMDGFFLKEMAAKIKRGLRGQLERGFATGGISFGYRTVPVPDPSGKTDVNGFPVLLGKRVQIVSEEARIVVQIFEWYASGLGIGRLVDRLNQEGFRGPRGRRWREGAVKWLLANEKYTGKLVWGKKTYERRPGTRQYVQRHIARDQWHVREEPDLRIVSDELWDRVQSRRASVRQQLPTSTGRTLMRGRNAAMYSRHLFSGFMTCEVCGGAIASVSGGKGSPRYGCLRAWRNGVAFCTNRLTVRAKVTDAYLLERLRAELLEPTSIRAITESLSAALNARLDRRPALLAETEAAYAAAQQRLQRLIAAIEAGVLATTLTQQIAERQAELTRLTAVRGELSEPIAQRLAIMPQWVHQQLTDVVGLLSDTPERTKTEFQRLGLKVSMQPIRRDDGRSFYRATVDTSLACLSGTTDFMPNTGATVDRSLLPTAP